MSYDDGRIACTGDALVIRGYYSPFGAFGRKRIRYSDIGEARRRTMGTWSGRYQIWGSGDFVHWWNYDPSRRRKSTAFVIDLAGKSTHPVITPDRPDDMAAELAVHGVTVTV